MRLQTPRPGRPGSEASGPQGRTDQSPSQARSDRPRSARPVGRAPGGDVGTLFREYARLDLKRVSAGLTVREFERWNKLRDQLDHRLGTTESTAYQERRSSRRVPTRLRCSFGSRKELQEAAITNLSTCGVFIRTRSPAAVGTPLELRIHIQEGAIDIQVEGVVVSTDFHPDQPGKQGMGVRFSTASAEAIEEISRLYAREAQRDIRRADKASGA